MADLNLQLCTPQPTYLIIEEIHNFSIPGIPDALTPVAPSGKKIFRRVAQVCDVQDIFFDNRQVQGMPTTWQYLRDFISSHDRITTRPTGVRELSLVFAGSKPLVQLPSINQFDTPDWYDREYDVSIPSPYTYGADPIPQHALYNNPMATFVMPGGRGPATALAIIRSGSSQLEFPPHGERTQAVQQLRRR